jgi:hypothetical protein
LKSSATTSLSPFALLQSSVTCISPLVLIIQANIVLKGEVGKMLGERWKALTDKEKIPYEKKATDDKARYEAEKARYQAVSP